MTLSLPSAEPSRERKLSCYAHGHINCTASQPRTRSFVVGVWLQLKAASSFPSALPDSTSARSPCSGSATSRPPLALLLSCSLTLSFLPSFLPTLQLNIHSASSPALPVAGLPPVSPQLERQLTDCPPIQFITSRIEGWQRRGGRDSQPVARFNLRY